jgi:plasmid maintenance system antidote protein VapI
MGRVGSALRQVLEIYGISQNKLAVTMGTDRANVNRWVKEQRDPAGDSIFQIKEALRELDPQAAAEFVRLYLGSGDGQKS